MEGQTVVDFFASSAGYGYYRPVVFTALRLFEILFGTAQWPHSPVADHALLWLLHGANAALVWALAHRLTGRVAAAWVAALFFAFMPFSYEAVAYVASLTHPLLTFWTLLALLVYDRALQRKGEGGQGRKGEREKGGKGAGEQLDRRRLAGPPEKSALSTADGPTGGRASEDARLLAERDSSFVVRHSSLIVLIIMSLGLLTHENGLFIFPALVGLDWLRRPGDTAGQRARRLWPFTVPPALFAVLWLLIPKSSEQGLNTLSDIARNVVPFLQTLVYPLLPILRLDSDDVWALVLTVAAVLALFAWLARLAGAGRLWIFGLGWFTLSALPALLFLQPAYVYGSPRLSYLPAIGAGLLWAIPALWLATDRRLLERRGAGGQRSRGEAERQPLLAPLHPHSPAPLLIIGVLLVAYTLAIILPPVPFIRCQLDFYATTSRFARDMAAAGAAAPAGRELVFVNAPFFFSSTAARPDGCPSPYPWTPVGGILIPPYAQARDFVRFNGGPDRPTSGVTYAGYAPGWRTFGPAIDGAALRQAAAEDASYVFDLTAEAFRNLSAAWQPDAGAVESPAASFGGTLQLAGARALAEDLALTVTLEWRVQSVPAELLAAFVHVYDAAGALVAQSDGPPGEGLAPQSLWQPGDGLGDTRRIDLLALAPGVYTVAAGVYRTTDGARLSAETDGQPLSDDVFIIDTIEVAALAAPIP
jgi:hypothetical protein